MNPYERHIIHTSVSELEGVRSESKGDGQDRRVVIYSTDPNASNLPDPACNRAGKAFNGNGRGPRGPRSGGGRGYAGGGRGGYNRGPRDGGGHGNGQGGSRGGYNRGPRDANRSGKPGYSNVPEREFAATPHDATQQPQAPSRTERIHDDVDDLALFGKIEL
ncbi:MAG: hypothetical protein PHO10_04570 [Gemmiger sp.]|nr:hypothetical protein [Gemmiger sp.]